MLTPVAIAEGQAVAETLFNHKPTAVDYAVVPSAVFSQPSIGTVGLTEDRRAAIWAKSTCTRATSGRCGIPSAVATSGRS